MSKLITVCESEWDRLVARVKELEDDLAAERGVIAKWALKKQRLQKQIQELEDGCCRFNCRTAKKNFANGAEWAVGFLPDGWEKGYAEFV